MIEVINENKKLKQIQMELLSPYAYVIIVGVNNRLSLFHMAIRFIWLNETKNVLMRLKLDI